MGRSFRVLRSKIRKSIIDTFLYLLGFRVTTGHWIYPPALTRHAQVIDLGANTGAFSKVILSTFGIKCVAIEPNQKLFRDLDASKMTKINLAITEHDGPVNFYISENHEASSTISDFQSLWDIEKSEQVEGVTWRTLLKKLNLTESTIDLLKVDIEGAELELIEHLSQQDCEKIHQLTFEFHHRLNPALLDRTKNSIRKLVSYDYLDISSGISPTEVLFIKESELRLNIIQKLVLSLYKRFKFNIL